MLVYNTEYAMKKILSYFATLLNIFSSFLVYLFSLFTKIPIFTSQSLWLCDLRTFRWYGIPIVHGAVDAMQFRRISPLSLTASMEEQMAEGLLVGPSSFHIQGLDRNLSSYPILKKSRRTLKLKLIDS
jgi:hypothetical protein